VNKNIFKYIGAAFNEINSLSCMYYANCNSSTLGNYNRTSQCEQNIYSRSPSLVSQECSATDNFCYGYYYNYTNYLNNALLGYFYYQVGCYYLPTNLSPTYGIDLLKQYDSNSMTYSYVRNLSSYDDQANTTIFIKPIQYGLKYFFCNTSNCNSQAGACFSAELVQIVFSSNLTSVGNFTSLPIYQSCSTGSNSSLPTFKLTIAIGLRVNQVFISDYNNLNSAASLSFIQNFTKFVNNYYLF